MKQTLMSIVFWSLAAIPIVELAPSPAVAVVTIAVAALAYMRIVARDATVSYALWVGTVWLGLALVTEIARTAISGHAQFALLAAPASPTFGMLQLATWLFAPALFARQHAR